MGHGGFLVGVRVDAGEAFSETGGAESSNGFGRVAVAGRAAVLWGVRLRWLSHGWWCGVEAKLMLERGRRDRVSKSV